MAAAVTRRGLFALGASRLKPDRGDAAAVGAALRELRAAEAGEPPPGPDATARARAAWGTGDPGPLFARLEPVAAALVERAQVGPGQTVLDVGAGTGSVALAAAARGAAVTALDLSPEMVRAGRERSAAAGAEVQWVEGDAQSLPFADAAFDVVLSSFGAIHAPDAREVAGELARVARPGATVALAAWRATGLGGRLLDLAASLDPPGPGAAQPSGWGRYERATRWFGDQVDGFTMDERSLRIAFADRATARSVLAEAPGPLRAALAAVDAEDRAAALARLDDLIAAADRSDEDGTVSLPAPYCLLTGRAP